MKKLEEIEKLKELLDSNAISRKQYDLLVAALFKEEDSIPNNDNIESKKSQNKNIINKNSILIDTEGGLQEWKTKNLAVKKFRNGKPIKQIKSPKQLIDELLDLSETILEAPHTLEPFSRWMYYNFDPSTESTHGLLYFRSHSATFFGIDSEEEKIVPKGWRLPNQYDIKHLFNSYAQSNEYSEFTEKGNYIDLNKHDELQALFGVTPGGFIEGENSKYFDRSKYTTGFLKTYKPDLVNWEDYYSISFSKMFSVWNASLDEDENLFYDTNSNKLYDSIQYDIMNVAYERAGIIKRHGYDEDEWEFNYELLYKYVTNCFVFIKCIKE
jgi:hypothetical protein